MSFNCSNCGAEIQYQQPHCLACGMPLDWSNTPDPAQSYNMQQAPEVATQAQYYQTQPYQQTASPGYGQFYTDNAPVLRNWKPSVWASILGIVLSSGSSSYSGGAQVIQADRANLIILAIIPIIIFTLIAIWGLIHTLVVYPSLFGPNPKMRSNAAISFVNCFLGGIIFGLLFNHNLSQGTKGVSNVVLAVFCGLGIVLGILSIPLMLSL